MSEITLRYGISAGDRSAIEGITASSGYFTEKEVRLALSVFDETMASPESSYRYLLAEMDDKVVGYACWGKDEQSDSSYELYWIAVDEAYRAHGIGKRLLHAVEESIHRLSPGGQLFIETSGRDQYYPTRNFYERQGYIKAAWLDDYFSPGDARVIYSKRL